MEDNPGDVGLVREALEEHSVRCELFVLTDGERAIEFIDEIDEEKFPCPDLVLIDLNLPKRPGKEVLQRLKASQKCSHVPAVVLTSSDNQRDKDEVARFAPVRYIRKPTRLADFIKLGALFKEILNSHD